MNDNDRQSNRSTMFEEVLTVLNAGQRFVVTGHEMVDGDSTGCELALHYGLKSLGKTVEIVNNETIMDRYQFLDPEGHCGVFDAAAFSRQLEAADAMIVVDNNSWSRLRDLEPAARAFEKPVICIDHHRVSEPFSAWHLYDTAAAATGELVFDLLKALGATIDAAAAEALFVALTADTGWFRYSNTTRRSFDIARELVDCGADPDRVNRETNYQETLELRRLMGRLWNGVQTACNGKVAWGVLSQEMVRAEGVRMKDTDGFIDELRTLKGVGIVALIKELANGEIKLSLRSSPPYSAHAVATQLGGGGHRHASGATLKGPLAEAVERVAGLMMAASN
ncbi:MAG: DHH family phosphoesterase [Planctomycetota bacterium]